MDGTTWTIPDQKYEDDPEGRAEQFFGLMRPEAEKMRGVYDAWMSYNEIGLGKDEGAKKRARRYSRFHVRWGDLMRQSCFTSCAYSFATGNPELDLWRYLAEGLCHCDLLPLHEYSAPMMAQDQSWLCLRYRRATAAFAPEARRPVVITECGIDGGPIGQATVRPLRLQRSRMLATSMVCTISAASPRHCWGRA